MEATMGLFRKQVTPVEQPPVAAGGSTSDKLWAGSNAALDKASAVYNKNPKLIGGLAAVAGAILLTRMKRGAR
jgi:hypothetical protein